MLSVSVRTIHGSDVNAWLVLGLEDQELALNGLGLVTPEPINNTAAPWVLSQCSRRPRNGTGEAWTSTYITASVYSTPWVRHGPL